MFDQFGPDGPFHFTISLAQDGAAPPTQGVTPGGPGGPGGPAPGGTTQSGAPQGSGAPTSGFGGNSTFFLILVFLGVILLMSVLGQRRERKRREAILSAVKKHDRVQTVGGVIGSVVEVKQHTVVLKVDESSNTRITFARSAIQQVLEEAVEESGK